MGRPGRPASRPAGHRRCRRASDLASLRDRSAGTSFAFVALDSEQTDARLKQLLPDAVLACPNAEAPAIVIVVEVHLHTDDPDCAEQALETLDALASWDEDADGRLADILQAALPAAVRTRMEELMRTGKYEYQSEFAKKYFARGHEQGRAAGEARALLVVLRSRGLDVPAEAARRIEQETDGARLEVWIRRAATATSIDDVFADE